MKIKTLNAMKKRLLSLTIASAVAMSSSGCGDRTKIKTENCAILVHNGRYYLVELDPVFDTSTIFIKNIENSSNMGKIDSDYIMPEEEIFSKNQFYPLSNWIESEYLDDSSKQFLAKTSKEQIQYLDAMIPYPLNGQYGQLKYYSYLDPKTMNTYNYIGYDFDFVNHSKTGVFDIVTGKVYSFSQLGVVETELVVNRKEFITKKEAEQLLSAYQKECHNQLILK